MLSSGAAQFVRNTASSGRVYRAIATAALTFAFTVPAAAQKPKPIAISGIVRDSAGTPVRNASVRLQRDSAPPIQTTTKADGSFAFVVQAPGAYTVIAERAGQRSAEFNMDAEPPEIRGLQLTIGAKGSAGGKTAAMPPPAGSMEFSDKPSFTIAGLTDWTAAGGHGSDVVLRTSETLNREAVTLKPDGSSSLPTGMTEEWKQREKALRAALAGAPEKFDTNHELGEFYLQAERAADAAPLLEKAYRIDPGNFENEFDLALALKDEGEFARARKHVGNLIARSESARVDELAGDLDEKLGEPLRAVHEFEIAARQDPSEENYFAWGSELLLHRAVLQAREVFSAGVKAYPGSERMLTALGAALFAGALYDEAAQRLCEASDLNSTDPEPYLFMGKAEIASPDPLPCVQTRLARFAAQRPADPMANYFYAMTIWKQKSQSTDPATVDQVQGLLTRAVTIDPKCSDAYLQLGVLQSTLGNYGKAIEFYRKAIDTDPQMSEAHYRLGTAYDRIGERAEAAQEFKLHDEISKQQAAAVEQQRREVKQFLVVVGSKEPGNP
jgi:Flp pilus assembly protein TadD